MNLQLNKLLHLIDLEEKEQIERYSLNEKNNLKLLKKDGLALHPIRISRKSFGYAEYPEISFFLPFPCDGSQFREGTAIECFSLNENESFKGILLQFNGKQGEFRLYTHDFPDWIEDEGIGLRLAPDTRTFEAMRSGIHSIGQSARLGQLFRIIHEGIETPREQSKVSLQENLQFINHRLNDSQHKAVQGICSDSSTLIIHGPPGTGKTTTLVEGILQLVNQGKKVLVSAPSNTAVDHISFQLISRNLNLLRIGNSSKVKNELIPYTPEGKLRETNLDKEIKKLRIRADELNKMANQYKRNFGKDERNQRNLLIKEVKSIRAEIRQLKQYNENKIFEAAQIILGTPIGLYDQRENLKDFEVLIIDEAGQCLEPLAWCIFPLADRLILAGDHLQLPPTVLSQKAADQGFTISVLEKCFHSFEKVHFLDTQYRMGESIAAFSSHYFYNDALKTYEGIASSSDSVIFYDTAGTDFNEEIGADGVSLTNKGELDLIQKVIQTIDLDIAKIAIISPYSGQIALAKEQLEKTIKCSTIDSFQGQECETIIISLVRSNQEGDIGFLKDYRRINVAMTRAKERLIIIGDSSTLSHDPFYNTLIEFMEKTGSYKSAWELIYA